MTRREFLAGIAAAAGAALAAPSVGESHGDLFTRCWAGLRRRGLVDEWRRTDPRAERYFHDRMAREVARIERAKLAGFFGRVADLCDRWAGQGIRWGPGHGLTPCSRAAFALGITEIDPVAHGLYMERWIPAAPPTPARPFTLTIMVSAARHGEIGLGVGDRPGVRLELVADPLVDRIGSRPLAGWPPDAPVPAHLRRVLVHRPATLEDLARAISLSPDERISRGTWTCEWKDPALLAILRPTGGVWLYREQITRTLEWLGGFESSRAVDAAAEMVASGGRALDELRERFVEGAAQRHWSNEQARRCFEEMLGSAGRCVDKCAAVGSAALLLAAAGQGGA